MRKLLFTTCLSLLLVPAIVLGQDYYDDDYDIVTDRPDQTESGLTVPDGSVQIEAGVEFSTGGRVKHLTVPTMLVRVGLLPELELRVGGAYISNTLEEFDSSSTIAGIGELSIGAKYQLFGTHRDILQGAGIVEIAPPIGTDGVAPESAEATFIFALSSDINSLEFGLNLGVEFVEGKNTSGLYSVVYGSDLGDGLGGFLELFGVVTPGSPPQHSLSAGTTLLLTDNLQLDLATSLPISDTAPKNSVRLGISWRLPE